MPCSPVHVPSIESARLTMRSLSRLASDQLLGLVRVEHKNEMKIAVPDMAHQSVGDGRAAKILLGLGYALGEPRDRHADIGCKPFGARAQRQCGVVRVMPRLP